MGRKCISTEEKKYDEENFFCTYTVEKSDGSRSYVLQFVRGEGGEQFIHYFLDDSADSKKDVRVFNRKKRTTDRESIVLLLAEAGTHHGLNITPKKYLERVINLLDASGMISESGPSQAFSVLVEPIKKLTGIEVNPAKLISTLVDMAAVKKAENRCVIS